MIRPSRDLTAERIRSCGCGLLISDQARAGTSNFASVYAKSAPATNKQIKALIEKYAKLEQQ